MININVRILEISQPLARFIRGVCSLTRRILGRKGGERGQRTRAPTAIPGAATDRTKRVRTVACETVAGGQDGEQERVG